MTTGTDVKPVPDSGGGRSKETGRFLPGTVSTLRHGHSKRSGYSRTYKRWASMRTRCSSYNSINPHRYIGRGIVVCERWELFDNFLADMGECPDGLTLDRINNDGNYEPGNCRWATMKEQMQNSSVPRFISFNGETKCLSDWATAVGLKRGCLQQRLKRGWSLEHALTEKKYELCV